jgi:hypothetical protein
MWLRAPFRPVGRGRPWVGTAPAVVTPPAAAVVLTVV